MYYGGVGKYYMEVLRCVMEVLWMCYGGVGKDYGGVGIYYIYCMKV